MVESVNRRDLLRTAIAAAGICAVTGPSDAARQAAPATGPADRPSANGGPGRLSAYAFESNVWVRVDEQPFTCYRAAKDQKYPYFFPVIGPSTGALMTDEAGGQFPHHRSVFLGCDRVNGANFWQEGLERGQIVSDGPKLESATPERVVITDHCRWMQPGRAPVIDDRRSYAIGIPQAGRRLLDADITLTALTDIHIGTTNHSFFSIRAARSISPAGGGTLVNSTGQSGEKDTFGQKAAWCCFSGTRLGHAESIVLMDHPGNPWSPCPWFTRDYGFMSPTPFYWFKEGWRLAKGQSVRVRYRVAVLPTAADAREIVSLYDAFAAGA